MAAYDDLDTRQIWVVGIISAVLTAVTILAVQVLYYALLNWHDEAKLAGSEYTQSIDHIEKQELSLSEYGRAKEGQILIPIDRAMELVAERSTSEAVEAKSDNEATNGNDAT